MRQALTVAMAMAVGTTWTGVGAAETWSKAYQFKPNIRLEIGADLGQGVHLESIEFGVADEEGSAKTSLFGAPKAVVTLVNLGENSVRLGIAIAVVDDAGRLLAASTGGTKMFPLRPERKMTYSLVFDDVNSEIESGTAFRITVETRH